VLLALPDIHRGRGKFFIAHHFSTTVKEMFVGLGGIVRNLLRSRPRDNVVIPETVRLPSSCGLFSVSLHVRIKVVVL
jgi:hypothetical protein